MRLLMYRDGRGSRLGALRDNMVTDVHELAPDLLSFIELGPTGMRQARELLDRTGVHGRRLQDLELLAPLDPPRGNILAIGRNYGEHAAETARARSEEVAPPTVFTKAQTSIAGPYDTIQVDSRVTSQVDWEAELAVVIGRRAKDVSAGEGLEYVFGYTVLNDISARDIQYGWGGQFFKGKSLDGFCPTGPWVVTTDEISDPQNLRVRLKVNGEMKQDANTRDMIQSVSELVSRLSIGMTLLPGTLIATGTPAGVGHGRTPPEFLRDGDIVETEIEGIGTMRNTIAIS